MVFKMLFKCQISLARDIILSLIEVNIAVLIVIRGYKPVNSQKCDNKP
jgi:hypothetical protein